MTHIDQEKRKVNWPLQIWLLLIFGIIVDFALALAYFQDQIGMNDKEYFAFLKSLF